MPSHRSAAAGLLLLAAVLMIAFDPSRTVQNEIIRRQLAVELNAESTALISPNDDDEFIPDDEERRLGFEDLAHLRIAVLGTGRTAGAGLHRHLVGQYTWPHLLSESVDNMSMRSSSADYPALCTYSMFGQNKFDVIILEYHIWTADTYVVRLVERLRHRYPEATIVFVRSWLPHQYHRRMEQDEMKDMIQALGMPDDRLLSHRELTGEIDAMVEEIKALGVHMFNLPLPDAPDVPFKLYGKDLVNFRWKGHRWVANQLRAFIKNLNVQPSSMVTPWSHKDTCHNWIEHGEHSLPHNEEMEMVEFADGMFALEARGDSNWFLVHNTLGHDAHIYIEYMAMGREVPIYPKAVMAFPGWSSGVLANPQDAPKRHVTQLQYLGVAPEGYKFLMLYPTSWATPHPFRVTAIIMTAGDEIPL